MNQQEQQKQGVLKEWNLTPQQKERIEKRIKVIEKIAEVLRQRKERENKIKDSLPK